jgi:hypothetical protein
MNEDIKARPFATDEEMAAFAVNDLAYIKPVKHDGASAFAIHAADGTPLTVVTDLAIAFATVRQHDMEPLSVH